MSEISKELLTAGKRALAQLRKTVVIDGHGFELYHAGIQKGRIRFGLFARDLMITALMLQNETLLRESIRFALATRGKRYDPLTGEEPGRVLHEFDDVERRGLKTRYNAGDTSQLLLIATAAHLKTGNDATLLLKHRDDFRSVIRYILSHIRGGLFWEDPRFCGAKRYALKSTYWKDSHLPGRVDPYYPVAYMLVQAQTIAALRAASALAKDLDLPWSPEELEGLAAHMVETLMSALWDDQLGHPLIARDGAGAIAGITSDGLHMLAYLKREDLPPERLNRIWAAADSLETPYGFRTYLPGQLDYSPTSYHWGAIWPFEQFFIARAALHHGRVELLSVTLRVLDALRQLGFVELCYWDEQDGLRGPGAIPDEGCDLQLWSAALPQALQQLLEQQKPA